MALHSLPVRPPHRRGTQGCSRPHSSAEHSPVHGLVHAQAVLWPQQALSQVAPCLGVKKKEENCRYQGAGSQKGRVLFSNFFFMQVPILPGAWSSAPHADCVPLRPHQ